MASAKSTNFFDRILIASIPDNIKTAFHFNPPRHPLKRSTFRKPLAPYALPGIVSGGPSRETTNEEKQFV